MATERQEAVVRTSRPSVRIDRIEQLAGGVDELGLRRGRPVVVLVGGADGMSEDDLDHFSIGNAPRPDAVRVHPPPDPSP